MENKSKNQNFWHFFFSALYLLLVFFAITFLNLQGKLKNQIQLFDFFLLSAATFRLIRIFVYDSVTEGIREYLGKFSSGPGKELSMLINCPWCTGIWMAFIIFVLYFSNSLFWYFIMILALAGIGSIMQIIASRISRQTTE
jgi:hypothetical protein